MGLCCSLDSGFCHDIFVYLVHVPWGRLRVGEFCWESRLQLYLWTFALMVNPG